MAILPKVKLKALPAFPSNVTGDQYISITKTAGNFTLSFDPAGVIATAFAATGGSESLSLPNWLAGTGRTSAPPQKAFWTDVDGVAPNSWRFRDRIFVGAATTTNDNRITGAVQTNWGSYANWAPRDSDMVVMSSRGTLALTAMSRTSDKAGVSPTPSTSALCGFLLNDAASAFGRALYLDVQVESGAGGSVGAEIVVKNKSGSSTATPYSSSGLGADGVWIVAGGDPSYGGTAANPCTTGLWFKPGIANTANHNWTKGIVFDQYSMNGTDGTDSDVGAGIAIEMAKQHVVRWLKPNGSVGAFLKSTVTNAGIGGGIRFDPTVVNITDAGGTVAASITPVTSAVNYINLLPSITGATTDIQAVGTDTNIPIKLSPKGTAGVRFKTDVSVSPGGSSPSAASSGRLFTNEGASALSTFNLPAAAVGLFFGFAVLDTDAIRVVANGSNIIHVANSASAAGGRIDNAVIGSMIWLVAVNSVDWVAYGAIGTWTVT